MGNLQKFPMLCDARQIKLSCQIIYITHNFTGQVPRLENYCGKTFAECTFNAITEFENSQRLKKKKHDQLLALNCIQAGRQVPPRLQNSELPVSLGHAIIILCIVSSTYLSLLTSLLQVLSDQKLAAT